MVLHTEKNYMQIFPKNLKSRKPFQNVKFGIWLDLNLNVFLNKYDKNLVENKTHREKDPAIKVL